MSQLPFDEVEQNLIKRADELEAKAKALREEAYATRNARDVARPLLDRLVFAADFRCLCGHGMAYDPTGEVGGDPASPFRRPSSWECSAILTGVARRELTHTGAHPFAFYEIKSENQPSAHGATTRQPAPPAPEAYHAGGA